MDGFALTMVLLIAAAVLAAIVVRHEKPLEPEQEAPLEAFQWPPRNADGRAFARPPANERSRMNDSERGV